MNEYEYKTTWTPTEQEKIEILLKAQKNSKELDAIWSVYKRHRDCNRYASNTVKEYDLELSDKASAIIDIIERYFDNKKNN